MQSQLLCSLFEIFEVVKTIFFWLFKDTLSFQLKWDRSQNAYSSLIFIIFYKITNYLSLNNVFSYELYLAFNLLKMKNYTIIEDLDIEYEENFNEKEYPQKLYECFLRNYFLIRRYAQQQNQLFLTKFKKKIIPKYVQEIYQYSQQIYEKHRKMLYSKRKIAYQTCFSHRKNRQSSPQLTNCALLNQSDEIQPIQKANNSQKQQSQNAFESEKQKSLTHQEKIGDKIQEKIPPKIKHKKISSPQIKKKLSQLYKKHDTQTKVYASIYNDSINFCKTIYFQTTLNQISRTRDQKQSQEIQYQFQKIRNSYNEEKTLETKMINILKQRKSHKNLKMKFFSNYINTKKSPQESDWKQNWLKSRQKDKDIIKQVQSKVNSMNFGLKGKICLPIKHKVTSSCNIQNMNSLTKLQISNYKILEQKNQVARHSIMKQQKQNILPSENNVFGMNKIFINTSKKFLLPKFS